MPAPVSDSNATVTAAVPVRVHEIAPSVDCTARPQIAQQPPIPICVLGMHRSGTSAVTRVLNLAGLGTSQHLLPPVAGDNDRGFWEPVEVVALHERLLQTLGSAWHDVRPLPKNWWLSPQVQPYRRELAQLLAAEFAGQAGFVVKDPRLCRLLPLWLAAFAELHWSPRFVMVVRNPLEVADSLARRDEMHPAHAQLLWLSHVLEAEHASRPFQRSIISFEELLTDWRETLSRVAKDLGICWPKSESEYAEEVARYLSPQLRHHAHGKPEGQELAANRWAWKVYRLLLSARSTSELEVRAGCNRMRRLTKEASAMMGPWCLQSLEMRAAQVASAECISELQALVSQEKQQAAAVQAQVDYLSHEVRAARLRGDEERAAWNLENAKTQLEVHVAKLHAAKMHEQAEQATALRAEFAAQLENAQARQAELQSTISFLGEEIARCRQAQDAERAQLLASRAQLEEMTRAAAAATEESKVHESKVAGLQWRLHMQERQYTAQLAQYQQLRFRAAQWVCTKAGHIPGVLPLMRFCVKRSLLLRNWAVRQSEPKPGIRPPHWNSEHAQASRIPPEQQQPQESDKQF